MKKDIFEHVTFKEYIDNREQLDENFGKIFAGLVGLAGIGYLVSKIFNKKEKESIKISKSKTKEMADKILEVVEKSIDFNYVISIDNEIKIDSRKQKNKDNFSKIDSAVDAQLYNKDTIKDLETTTKKLSQDEVLVIIKNTQSSLFKVQIKKGEDNKFLFIGNNSNEEKKDKIINYINKLKSEGTIDNTTYNEIISSINNTNIKLDKTLKNKPKHNFYGIAKEIKQDSNLYTDEHVDNLLEMFSDNYELAKQMSDKILISDNVSEENKNRLKFLERILYSVKKNEKAMILLSPKAILDYVDIEKKDAEAFIETLPYLLRYCGGLSLFGGYNIDFSKTLKETIINLKKLNTSSIIYTLKDIKFDNLTINFLDNFNGVILDKIKFNNIKINNPNLNVLSLNNQNREEYVKILKAFKKYNIPEVKIKGGFTDVDTININDDFINAKKIKIHLNALNSNKKNLNIVLSNVSNESIEISDFDVESNITLGENFNIEKLYIYQDKDSEKSLRLINTKNLRNLKTLEILVEKIDIDENEIEDFIESCKHIKNNGNKLIFSVKDKKSELYKRIYSDENFR